MNISYYITYIEKSRPDFTLIGIIYVLHFYDCHLHAILSERLKAVHQLRFQHNIKTLCRILGVNRSTYYKHYHSEPAPRTSENQYIKSMILHIYADYNKRIGAQMSTYKPRQRHNTSNENSAYPNHLKQKFIQEALNLVWVSDFTYIKTGDNGIIFA